MESHDEDENGVAKKAKKKESKFYETLFLGTMAGFGLLVGFSSGVSLARKKNEDEFYKGLMMLDERPNVTSKPKLESGTRLAMRALGIGSIYAVAGVSLVSALIWFGVGAKDLKDFRQKMGEILPTIPRNNPPTSRTEFESFRDLFTYLSDESEKSKKPRSDN